MLYRWRKFCLKNCRPPTVTIFVEGFDNFFTIHFRQCLTFNWKENNWFDNLIWQQSNSSPILLNHGMDSPLYERPLTLIYFAVVKVPICQLLNTFCLYYLQLKVLRFTTRLLRNSKRQNIAFRSIILSNLRYCHINLKKSTDYFRHYGDFIYVVNWLFIKNYFKLSYVSFICTHCTNIYSLKITHTLRRKNKQM